MVRPTDRAADIEAHRNAYEPPRGQLAICEFWLEKRKRRCFKRSLAKAHPMSRLVVYFAIDQVGRRPDLAAKIDGLQLVRRAH